MSVEKQALQLIERIYEAAIEPDTWATFVVELSEAFGGAAVALSVQRPGNPYLSAAQVGIYRTGLLDEFSTVFRHHYQRGLPWGSVSADGIFLGCFGLASEVLPDDKLRETDFYKEFMEPQGLAPEGPITHVIHLDPDTEVSGLAIYRRVGGREFNTNDLALGNVLVPHLARAFEIQRKLAGNERRREALTEVIDRLPTGVILLDSRGRPVVTNRSAVEMAALEDGLRIDSDSPRAWDPQENTQLRKIIDSAIESCLKDGDHSGQVMTITRPSGRRPFVALISSLLRPVAGATSSDPVAALFVGDPGDVKVSTSAILEGLYSLTRAEAELVGLLAEGNSLDQIANIRGITMNTARSQLKQVFAKTDTCRQGELVQLILSGVATIQQQ